LKTYHVGILGFGMIGKVHAYGYAALPYCYDPVPLRARIARVVAGSAETAEKARQMLGIDAAGTDYRTVTENPEIDIVHICTPNHLHRDALLSAIAHGKHIYCEKPLTASWAEAEEVRAAIVGRVCNLPNARQVANLPHDEQVANLPYDEQVTNLPYDEQVANLPYDEQVTNLPHEDQKDQNAPYGGVGQMVFQNRFFPATIRAKRMIDAGALGDVLGFRVAYLHDGSANPAAPLKWKLTAAAGGGVIADLGSHALDLVEWLVGPIASVMAAAQIAYAHRPALNDPAARLPVDAEDCVTCLARLPSGALGTIEATKIATGMEDELRFEIHGTRGALRFNLMDPNRLEWHDAAAPDRPLGGLRGWNRIEAGQRYEPPATTFPNPKATIGWVRGHVACLANFLQAVAEGRPTQPDLMQGVRVQHLMECLRRSAAEHRWVETRARRETA